jgi:tRNA(adenine34) deaminase
MNTHEIYMRMALVEAKKAADLGEVPVGAVITHEGRVVGRGHNQTEGLKDPTAHAEILAITAAANTLGSWRLEGCTLYVTLEPCTMCGGALVLARMPQLVFGASDPKAGACGSVHNVVQKDELNHQVEILSGILEPECATLLRDFFRDLRARAKRTKAARLEAGNPERD